MDAGIQTIKQNLDASTSLAYRARCISTGQIEELASICDGKRLNAAQAERIFVSAFGSELVSYEYYSFLSLLHKNRVLETGSRADVYKRNCVISFLRNKYSAEALERFLAVTGGVSETETDFNSVCEAVYSGRSNYAIVPLFNTSDGLMISLYRLIMRYELKIISEASIMMADGATETRFMLLARRNVVCGEPARLFCSITHEIDDILPGLLAVTSAAGIRVRSLNTLPLEYTDDRNEVIIDFDTSLADTNVFSTFLKTALPDINIIGMYITV